MNQTNEVNLQQIIPQFTLRTICESAMGVKLETNNQSDKYISNIHKAGHYAQIRAINPFLHPKIMFVLTGLNFMLEKCVKEVHSFSWGVIDRRREIYKNSWKENVQNKDNMYAFSYYHLNC